MSETKVKNASPYPALAAALGQVPRASGVYLFKDAAGKVLYVGKAVNLRNRLGSYLKIPARQEPKTALFPLLTFSPYLFLWVLCASVVKLLLACLN